MGLGFFCYFLWVCKHIALDPNHVQRTTVTGFTITTPTHSHLFPHRGSRGLYSWSTPCKCDYVLGFPPRLCAQEIMLAPPFDSLLFLKKNLKDLSVPEMDLFTFLPFSVCGYLWYVHVCLFMCVCAAMCTYVCTYIVCLCGGQGSRSGSSSVGIHPIFKIGSVTEPGVH